MFLAALALSLTPWRGPSLPTATAAAAKYRLAVHGSPHQAVHLRVENLARGWMAAFCTPHFCSPLRYTMRLDDRGGGEIEFEAIRLDDSGRKRVRIVVAADESRAAVDVTAR